MVLAMAVRTSVVCVECGTEAPQWSGRCSACQAWNTLVEQVSESDRSAFRAPPRAVPMVDVDANDIQPFATGVDELDRVLGGGLVPGSVTLVGGEPGIGKSTLLLQVAVRHPGASLYVTAEESAGQLRGRAERVGAVDPSVLVAAETNLDRVLQLVDEVGPALVIVDSIQTVVDPATSSTPGSTTQVRECALRLVNVAKRRNIAVVLVGHVTKDGGLAGPRVLEHLVDTVVSFEGDRHGRMRVVRAVKHRFGPTSEVGLLDMVDSGLVTVADPSRSFLADRRRSEPGSAVVALVEGRRPLLVEVQALVVTTASEHPRRYAHGLDANRLNLMLAVLDRHVGLPVRRDDVYAMSVGGVRVAEPGADAGVALAVASSVTGKPLPDDLVIAAEVGLGGELRAVGAMQERLNEAARLGFTRAVVPSSSHDIDASLAVHPFGSLCEVAQRFGLAPTERR